MLTSHSNTPHCEPDEGEGLGGRAGVMDGFAVVSGGSTVDFPFFSKIGNRADRQIVSKPHFIIKCE